MNEASAPAPRGSAAATVAAVLLIVAIAGGWALYGRPSTPSPRPVPGDTLLEDQVAVGSAGVARRFRVKQPCTVEFRIDPPAGSALDAQFGVPGPVEASPADAPAAATAVRWTVASGDAPRREVVLAPGLYVLRLEGRAAAEAAPTRIVLKALPAR